MNQIVVQHLREEEIRVAREFFWQNIVRRSKKADVHIQVANLLQHCATFQVSLVGDLYITPNDLLESTLRGFRVAEHYYRQNNHVLVADTFWRYRQQFEEANLALTQVGLYNLFLDYFPGLFKYQANLFND
ncbi:MAG: hypothetical protein WCP93_03220 [Candidatus Berkelbacteria bacterium]